MAKRLFLVALLIAGCSTTAGPSPTAPPETSAAPVATFDPEAEIKRIMDLRSEWGLQSDRDWVIEVASIPDADTSILGIPLSPEEVAQMEEMFGDDARSRLIAYGYAHPDEFGGSFVDRSAGGRFVMLFTAGLDRHRAAIEALPGDYPFEIRGAQHTEAELTRLMDILVAELTTTPGVQFMSVGLDTIGNALTVEAKSNDPTFEAHLEAEYPGLVNATIYPLPGPWANAESGSGWRLVAAGIKQGGDEGYRVRAATTDEEWQELWTHMDPVNPIPGANLDNEIIVSFGHAIGSSCQEVRLDGVVIDKTSQLIYSQASDPLAPRDCTADLAGAAFFIVGLDRATLPESPFTVQVQEDVVCGGCEDSEQLIVDLSE